MGWGSVMNIKKVKYNCQKILSRLWIQKKFSKFAYLKSLQHISKYIVVELKLCNLLNFYLMRR